VLLPHWFDDVVKLGMGGLETGAYEWPGVGLMRGGDSVGVDDGGDNAKEKEGKGKGKAKGKGKGISPDKKRLFQSITWTDRDSPVIAPAAPTSSAPHPQPETTNVWAGRRVLLSRSLELYGGRREAVEVGVRRAGGVVLPGDYIRERDPDDPDEEREEEREEREETKLVSTCDVFVTRYRHGDAYLKVRPSPAN
jgi:mediator of DNA damage checkpoint protein 1